MTLAEMRIALARREACAADDCGMLVTILTEDEARQIEEAIWRLQELEK